jgi:hypothetical protein
VQDSRNSQNFNRYSYCINNPLRYTDPSGYNWFTCGWDWVTSKISQATRWTGNEATHLVNWSIGEVSQAAIWTGREATQFGHWTGDHWVQVADVTLTAVLITAECLTGQFYLIVPTINAGLNVWNNADNIQKHPGNFATFYAIGAGTGYIAAVGGGPLVAGLQTGLNDLVRGDTKNIWNDMLFATIGSTISLGLGATLNQSFGLNKVLSYTLGNMAGTYLSGSYNYHTGKFDWSLNANKVINIAGAGVMGGLDADAQYQVAKNMCIPGNFLTNFEIPTFNNSVTPSVLIPYVPSINLPSYYPGMPSSPLPLPQITPIPGN